MTVRAAVSDYDPLRDKSYRDTALGPEVLAWLSWLDLGGAADRTLDQYERDLSVLCHLFPSKGLSELTDLELGTALKRFPKDSRRVRKAAFASFFKWALKTRRIEQNPVDFLPDIKRRPQSHIDVFSDAEVEDLLSLPVDDAVLMAILLEAGLRKSEACALQVRRVNIPDREIVVVRGKGGKDRSISLTDRLWDELRSFLEIERLAPQDHLWYSRPGGGKVSRSRPLGAGSFARWWERCLTTAGVRYRNPHVARHTYATRYLRDGGRLETLSGEMGHSSIRTTFDLYAHLDKRDVARDLAIINAAREINPD